MKPWVTYFGAHVRTMNQNGSIIVQRENPSAPGAWVDVKTYNASWADQHTEAHLHAQALAHGEPYPSITKADSIGRPCMVEPTESQVQAYRMLRDSITKAACIGRPQLPEPTESEIESYRLALGAHDWFYEYSDDHRVYTQGRDSELALRRLAARLDPDLVIWSEYAPS